MDSLKLPPLFCNWAATKSGCPHPTGWFVVYEKRCRNGRGVRKLGLWLAFFKAAASFLQLHLVCKCTAKCGCSLGNAVAVLKELQKGGAFLPPTSNFQAALIHSTF